MLFNVHCNRVKAKRAVPFRACISNLIRSWCFTGQGCHGCTSTFHYFCLWLNFIFYLRTIYNFKKLSIIVLVRFTCFKRKLILAQKVCDQNILNLWEWSMVLKEGGSVKVTIFWGYGTRDWDFNSKLKLYLRVNPECQKVFLHNNSFINNMYLILNIFVLFNQTQNKIWIQKQSKQADF